MDMFRQVKVLERALDIRSVQHHLIASNIANEETPGYRAKEIPFKEALAEASRATPSVHRETHQLLAVGASEVIQPELEAARTVIRICSVFCPFLTAKPPAYLEAHRMVQEA